LTITNDKFTLATANRHHGVDRLEASLDRLVDGTAGEDTRSLELSTALFGGLDWAFAVDGVPEGINDTTKKGFADWNIDLLYMLVWRQLSLRYGDAQFHRYA
jgi:hypothetical protein